MTQGLKTKPILFALSAGAMALGAASLALPLGAQDLYRNKIDNDMRQCAPGGGPAVRVTVQGVKNGRGVVRVQSYRGTKADWLEKGRWLNRIEAPARSGTMYFCMPVPETGNYGIAVRHDVNGNGKTDLSEDGGGMSNNPSINIFNLGKPSYTKTAFEVGAGVTTIRVQMKYM
ncbi:DUF2141 domain-containing protein [Erythrobacteraceae bacterium E2-1 Yellow Sea]|nr:DUF2141 domain-containing protein [Erythrobacteraceae bacterium E2-1 Yellow Sea]